MTKPTGRPRGAPPVAFKHDASRYAITGAMAIKQMNTDGRSTWSYTNWLEQMAIMRVAPHAFGQFTTAIFDRATDAVSAKRRGSRDRAGEMADRGREGLPTEMALGQTLLVSWPDDAESIGLYEETQRVKKGLLNHLAHLERKPYEDLYSYKVLAMAWYHCWAWTPPVVERDGPIIRHLANLVGESAFAEASLIPLLVFRLRPATSSFRMGPEHFWPDPY